VNTYKPERWVIVKFNSPTDTHYKCFAGWYGSYTGSASWKLNSGITKIVETEDSYEFYGYSGSCYICHKGGEGMSGYMASVYQSFVDQLKDTDRSLELVNVDSDEFRTILEELK
jgi:hypothetical protein